MIGQMLGMHVAVGQTDHVISTPQPEPPERFVDSHKPTVAVLDVKIDLGQKLEQRGQIQIPFEFIEKTFLDLRGSSMRIIYQRMRKIS